MIYFFSNVCVCVCYFIFCDCPRCCWFYEFRCFGHRCYVFIWSSSWISFDFLLSLHDILWFSKTFCDCLRFNMIFCDFLYLCVHVYTSIYIYSSGSSLFGDACNIINIIYTNDCVSSVNNLGNIHVRRIQQASVC